MTDDSAYLSKLVELREQPDVRIRRLEADKAELLDALKPFASFAPQAQGFVQARSEQGGSPILLTRHFRVADFATAAALVETHGGRNA